MSQMFRDVKAVEPKTSEMGGGIVQREGVIVVEDEGRKDEFEEGDGHDGDVTPSVSGRSSARKSRKTLFTRRRLRIPSSKMNMTETSILTGHAIRRAVKADRKICKMIARLKEEKYALERDLKAVQRDFDASMTVSENLS
ncbi:hypothetical protein Dimus_001167 [Dionaea muscipula]